MSKLFFILFFILSFSPFTYSQQSEDLDVALYNWFDNSIGIENTRLFNGIEYVEKHRIINNQNKFLRPITSTTGDVLYDGQWFYDLPMRYNVFDDLLLVQLESKLGSFIIQLIKEKVGRFRMNEQTFLNIPSQDPGSTIQGFHEILWEGPQLIVLKKHAKKVHERRDKQVAYYEFETISGYYGIKYGNKYHAFGSRRDLLRIFPEQKDLINSIYKRNSNALNLQPDLFHINLLKEVTSALQDNNKLARE